MKVTYKNSVEDWAAVQAHHLQTTPGFRESITFWRWTFALGMAMIVVLVAGDWSVWARGLLGLSLALLVYVWYPRYLTNAYRTRGLKQLNVKESERFLTCQRVVELTDGGVRIESLAGTQLIKWEFIKAVDETARHIFIRFWFGLGLPIPKECMTVTEKDAFVTSIRARVAPPAHIVLNSTVL